MNAKINIVGVPEHFNLPWHLAFEEGAFLERGINLEWTDVPEGTGKMARMLESGEADMAVILTEGLIKAISGGLRALIAQEFIASPLLWGVHVHSSSPIEQEKDLRGKTAAISRYGSGSHLMAFVHGRQMDWPLDILKFKVVNTLEGAVAALAHGEADYFMWERFTTQPLVDKAIFRRVGQIPTPWPCFVIAVREAFASEHATVLRHILEIINTFTREFKDIPSIDRTLSNRYGQKIEAIRQWLDCTRWSQEQISTEEINIVIDTLSNLNLLSNNISAEDLLLKDK